MAKPTKSRIPKPAILDWGSVSSARKANSHRVWTAWNSDRKPVDEEGSAYNRFHSGKAFMVASSPSFTLEPGSTIYTIGSCFARNVEVALNEKGFNVPTLAAALPPEDYSGRTAYANTVLNKYTPYSMADEIMRGLGMEYPDMGLVEVRDGWYDPQASYLNAFPRERAVEIRTLLDETSKKLLDADALVLTLGLTETWRIKATGATLNHMNGAIWRGSFDQIEFFNAGVTDCFEVLSTALDALFKRRRNMKVIITVSPVPMASTFSGQDVVAANTYSKAVLRVVAQMIADRYPLADYFPSYEMVTNSPRALAWYPDQIHPTRELVGEVIGEFARRYAGSKGVETGAAA